MKRRREREREKGVETSRQGSIRTVGGRGVYVYNTMVERGQNKGNGVQEKATVLVTVGTTKFEALTRAADSPSLVRLLASQGYNKLVLQIGSSETFFPSELFGDGDALSSANAGSGELSVTLPDGFEVTCFRYAPTLKDIMDEAGLVISHAGAGSIFESLRAGKRLIAVPNSDLMDNHQADLCAHLKAEGYIEVADVDGLERAVVRMAQRRRGEGAGDLKSYACDDGRGIADAILKDANM